ncbi:MAG: uracil-DNA glycosylase family protein [Syntrophothermus sp.]
MTFADHVIEFNKKLKFTGALPQGVSIMNPFREDPRIMPVVKKFYEKFYNDNRTRRIILGINPGRSGAGVTGIPFTDTKRMTEKCGIEIPDLQTHEPSSVFIYEVIEAYGGVKKFYNNYYINSICPLGFTVISKSGRSVNYNYYDSRELTLAMRDFIIKSIRQQIKFGIDTSVCYCLGTGKNMEFLSALNDEKKFFDRIVPLDHPSRVMAYMRSRKDEFLQKFIKILKN